MKQLIAYTENGKWGYRDKETNEILIPAKYDEIDPSAEELDEECFPIVYDDVQVKFKGKWGVRSVTNKKILPFLYDRIKSRRNVFLVKIKNKYGVVNRKGEKITPVMYDEMDGYSMIRVRQNDKWGALNEDGWEILPVVFDEIQDNILAPCFEITLRGRKGIITYGGSIIVPPDYEDVYTFEYYHTFGVKKDGKWQIVDRKNRPKNSQLYDEIKGIYESGIIAVSNDNKWGFIYANGQEAYPVCVEDFKYTQSFIPIKIKDKWGALSTLDWKIEEVLPVIYDSVEVEHLGLRQCVADGKFGVIDPAGNNIVPPIYDSADIVCCDFANKVIGKKEGANDAVYIPPQYIEVSKDGKWGVFDVFGNEKIPVMYDVLSFSYDHNDLIPAFLNGKWGYINIDNEIIIPFIYDEAHYFGEHYAEVAMGDKFGFIDRRGNLIRPLEYDWIITLGEGMVRVSQNGKVFEMEMDSTGKIIERYDRNTLVNIKTLLKQNGI